MTLSLEQQLGELTGQLRNFVPAVERMEERLRAIEAISVRVEAEYVAMRRDYEQLSEKIGDRHAEIYTYMDTARLENNTRKSEIVALAKDLNVSIRSEASALRREIGKIDHSWDEEKKRRAGFSGKLWEILKLVLAGAAGAAFSLLTK